MKTVDCYVVGKKEDSFGKLIDKKLQEMAETPLYDNDMELGKKPTK